MLACTEKQMPVSEASTRCAGTDEGSACATCGCVFEVLHLDHIPGGRISKSSVRTRDSVQ